MKSPLYLSFRSTAVLPRAGFTMIELLVSISIVVILASLLLPALFNARRGALAMECVSNLKQLYFANSMFADEHDGRFVPAAPDIDAPGGGLVRWHGERETTADSFDPKRGALFEYMPDADVKQCPVFKEFVGRDKIASAFESGTGGYGYSETYVGGTAFLDAFPKSFRRGVSESHVFDASNTIMFADAALPQNGYLIEYGFIEPPHFPTPQFPRGNTAWGFASPSIHFRHSGRANVLWCDGHVTSEEWEWAPEKNFYGGSNLSAAVGWFGPQDNRLFDSGDKRAYNGAP